MFSAIGFTRFVSSPIIAPVSAAALLLLTISCPSLAQSSAIEKSAHSKKAHHRKHQTKNIAVSRGLHPIAYPRNNFLPYGYFSAARSSNVDLRAWSRSSASKCQAAVSGLKGSSLSGNLRDPQRDDFARLIAEQEKRSERQRRVDTSGSGAKKSESPEIEAALSAASVGKNSNGDANAAKKAIPFVKGNALLSSVSEKMSAIRFPNLNVFSSSISPVSILVFLGMLFFWLSMIFRAICGSHDRGMRSRLAEHPEGKKRRQ